MHRSLLIAAWLVCQLLAFVHVTQHAALDAERACVLCVHAPGLDAGATAPLVATSIPAPSQDLQARLSHETRFAVALSKVLIRGPPATIG